MRRAFACAGHHGFETGGLGNGGAAHVERVNHLCDPPQRGLLLQPEARDQHLERHAFADVRERGAVEVETECVSGAGTG